MESENPKVLVISHNPFSDTQNNGKTLSAFFKGWPKDKIAQLYLTLDKFDTTVCEKFYRITDLDVLKTIFSKKQVGIEYTQTEEEKAADIAIKNGTEKEKLHKNKLYLLIRDLYQKRNPFMYCIRNLAWKIVKPWKQEKLNKWIDDFNPDVVFFQSSNVYAIFDMVYDICKKRNIPLVMETTDDYVTSHFSIDPFYWIDHYKMKNRYTKAVKYSSCIFAIGDMMAKEYQERFGGNFKVAMNSISIKNKVTPYVPKEKEVNFLYAGNLGLNRWKVLHEIGIALKEIVQENDIKINFEVYSIERPQKEILKALTIENIMTYKGSLDSEELLKKRNESDILVHVESFDKKNKYITRLSVSTKIPEYLVSKRCILAVGPKNVASIRYIEDNDLGVVITTNQKKQMKEKLIELVTNSTKRTNYANQSLDIIEEKHNAAKTKNLVQLEVKNAVMKTSSLK